MGRGLRDLGKGRVQERCAKLVFLNRREVPDAQFRRRLGEAWFLAAKDDLDLRMQTRPTPNRVPLDQSAVAGEWLWNGKKRQHFTTSVAPDFRIER